MQWKDKESCGFFVDIILLLCYDKKYTNSGDCSGVSDRRSSPAVYWPRFADEGAKGILDLLLHPMKR